nr:MAG TPA: Pre-mRNA-splicing factor 8, Pre-mRNA-splicing factor-mRNA splicing, spliceosome, post-catalytic, P [Caudoviricetes sp.]
MSSYQEEWDSLKELYNSTTDEADRKSIMDEIKSL